LLDSGASENFIDLQLVQKYNLPKFPLLKPSKTYNADGSRNKARQCTYYTKLKLEINGQKIIIYSKII
ncbi:hypothetical protein AN958_03802, partial [Leucoagaricus sp. SymC.cos]